MELRQLRYFIAVAEELHFRRAAERLYVAQPAVSEQVRKLELELGVRLFDRTNRHVAITAAGAALLEEGRRVLKHAEAAERAARHAQQRAASRLRIGYLPDLLSPAVPRALRQLTRTVRPLSIELEVGTTTRLLHAVRERELDAAVVALPAATAGLRVTSLGHEDVIAALPVGDPRAVAASLRLADLVPERLVTMPREFDPAFHDTVVSLCRAAGVAPALEPVGDPRMESVLLAVAAGAGIALVPASVAERYGAPGVRFVPLEEGDRAFEPVVITHPEADNPVVARFLTALGRTPGERPQPREVVPEPVTIGLAA